MNIRSSIVDSAQQLPEVHFFLLGANMEPLHQELVARGLTCTNLGFRADLSYVFAAIASQSDFAAFWQPFGQRGNGGTTSLAAEHMVALVAGTWEVPVPNSQVHLLATDQKVVDWIRSKCQEV